MDKEDDRDKVIAILKRANPALRIKLNLNEEFYVALKATVPEVISDDEHQEIKAISVTSEKIDRLLDLMKRKSMNVFFSFMIVLQKKDNDLYKKVRAIQNDLTGEKDGCVLSVATTQDTLKRDTHRFNTTRLYCGTCHKPVSCDCIKQNPNVHDHYDDMVQETHTISVAAATSLGETGGASSKPELNSEFEDGAAAVSSSGYVEEGAISKMEINRPTKPLAVVRLLESTPNKTWKQTGQFNTATRTDTHQFYPLGIAIRPDGELVVVGLSRQSFLEGRSGQICKVFSRDGRPRPMDDFGLRLPLDHLRSAWVIAITQDNSYISPGINSITVYDNQGIRDSFSTYDFKLKLFRVLATTINGLYGYHFKTPNTLAVDSKGLIIAGLMSSTISIYNGDGCLRSKFYTSAPPNCLDITSKGAIAVTFYDNSLQVMDYSGNNVRVLERPRDVDQWLPSTVCCSKQDEIFVVNRGDNSVYRYTADGDQCLGCIVQWLDNPQGIAITDDGEELYVVEHNQSLVKIFQRQWLA